MYQPNLQHILAKSALARSVQDYDAALSGAGSFLREIEKAHANPLPGDPLAKSTFSELTSPTSGLTYYDLETGAKFVYPLLTPLRNEIPRVSGKGGIQANWRAVTGVNTTGLRIGVSAQSTTPDYTGLQIQTAVNTLPIPVVWGQSKLAPNVIWYDDFQTHGGSSGGKGGLFSASSTTYTYTASVMMALCEGPIAGINQIWKGQSIYTLSALGLSLFNGSPAFRASI